MSNISTAMRRLLRRPAALVRRLARRIGGPQPVSPVVADETGHAQYDVLYEAHARATGDDGVGGGDYDVIGEIELDVLRAEGLRPDSTLLDFGCGNGRLAVHAVKYLDGGTYIGTDIAPTFLADAARRVARAGATSCTVRLLRQVGETFDVPDHSVDIACAFSVFTHMEHEDLYRYLMQFKRIVRPGGRLIISCLPMDLADARYIFVEEAAIDPIARWERVRNITTSMDLVDQIVTLAGWNVVHWLRGTEGQAASTSGEMRGIGQSIVSLTLGATPVRDLAR